MTTRNSLWCDDTFNVTMFTGAHLSFLKDFLVDYKEISNHPSSKWSNLKKIHLLRFIFMERIDREECAKENKE